MPNLANNNCRYTPLTSTSGTNTVNQGPGGAASGYFSVLYGVAILGLGTNTACVVNAYEFIPPTGQGTNTATITNLLANGTCTAAGMMVTAAGPAAQGVRYSGNLVVVVAAGVTANALWD